MMKIELPSANLRVNYDIYKTCKENGNRGRCYSVMIYFTDALASYVLAYAYAFK